MNLKFVTAALLLNLMFGTACVRRTVTQDFGLSGGSPRSPLKRPAISPDTSLRGVFKQKTKRTFEPLSDDPRVQELRARLTADPQDANAILELGAVYEGYRLYDTALEQYLKAEIG